MDVFLLFKAVRFCDVLQVDVVNSTSLVHKSAVCVKV